MEAALDLIGDYYGESAVKLRKEKQDTFQKIKISFIIIGFMALLISIFFAFTIISSVNSGIRLASKHIDELASGSLCSKLSIDRNDEFGHMLKKLMVSIKKLSSTIVSIKDVADNFADASLQISNTSQQISRSANDQAASVEEISSTMEEIAANIEQNTENASQTERISDIARKGIEDVSQSSQDTIDATKEISQKITIITDIAFQTNILALNAAVEAARAGEHGRGFAVVAAEVRKLAERSKIAAEEIVQIAQGALEQAEKTGKRMHDILPEVVKTARLVQEIFASSQEQNNGATQVNNAIQQLNELTQQNAATSEELAANSESTNNQANQLKDKIGFFRIDNEAV